MEIFVVAFFVFLNNGRSVCVCVCVCVFFLISMADVFLQRNHVFVLILIFFISMADVFLQRNHVFVLILIFFKIKNGSSNLKTIRRVF